MGCGCGGAKPVQMDYIHTDKNGVQHTYSNEYEARAGVIRDGGSWRAVPKQGANA